MKKQNILLFAILLIIIIPFGKTSEFVPLKRATVFIDAVTTGESEKMIDVDHSASIRIVPFILCIQRIDLKRGSGWVGEGTGSTSKWMHKYVPGVPYGWSGGAIANYILEYGLILGILFIFLTFNCCIDKQFKISTIGLWIMCVVLIGVNSQIGWLCILMLYISKNLRKTHENKSILRLT